ncbi:MAG: HD domain-containing protein, partial [Candidatus Shapirobacteria bacterium]
MSINEKKLIQQIVKRSSNPELIESAFEFAKTAYKDKFMFSGENHIFHALRVALMLEKMNLDPKTIAFGLMHDVLDDKSPVIKEVELKVIEKKFGKDIGHLIQKISELRKIRYTIETNIKTKKKFTREKLENTKKMFLAIAGDLRVVIVELISRLDALKSFKNIPEERLKLQSIETLQIFVPIARRLGLNEIRRELEDISFSYLFPK